MIPKRLKPLGDISLSLFKMAQKELKMGNQKIANGLLMLYSCTDTFIQFVDEENSK